MLWQIILPPFLKYTHIKILPVNHFTGSIFN